MNIEVIGGGALGLLFAAGAVEGGASTLLYTRGEEQARQIIERGIEVHEVSGRSPKLIPSASLNVKSIGRFAERPAYEEACWIILAVKQKDLDDRLIHLLKSHLQAQDRIVCLQNGVGHIERLRQAFPDTRVYAAITTEGARRLDPISILHAGKGSTSFGLSREQRVSLTEGDDAEKKWMDVFAAAGLALQMSNDIETIMYRKLTINAVINPLTAIWRVQNGALLETPQRTVLMRNLFDEIMSVYRLANISFEDGWWEDLLQVCRSTAQNRSSMLEDVTHGRLTEVRWICGGIVDLARQHEAEAPLNALLMELVEGMGTELHTYEETQGK
ncbi:hypothetical protein B9G55_01040 [Saccharibacillus sp. O16]|nr:hypothetical protein B9G55_01040 [Saccharibacillus sp. O16]